jgi:transketolase
MHMDREQLVPELEKKAKGFRRDIIEMLYRSQSGHPGGSLSEIDILTVLYFHKLKLNPRQPDWPERDRFVLSKGHATPGLYSVLAAMGFFPREELWHFRQVNSLLQGHADINVPGVEQSTGSLGMGLSFGNGIALARKLDGKSYKVIVMMGDGEQQEGQVWEAAMTANHHKLDIIAILDKNGIQNDSFVDRTKVIDPIIDKWKAFGWHVEEGNGHDMNSIIGTLDRLWNMKGPRIAVFRTVKGKGVSFMENNPDFHGRAPNEEEYKKAMEELK